MIAIFIISGTSAYRIDSTMIFIRNILNINESYTQANEPVIAVDWLKVGHFIGYGLLGSSLYFAFWGKSRYAILNVFITVFVYSLTDEFHQRFVPGRSGSVSDVLLDVASALLLALIFHFKIKIRQE
jgi:VanZ family protein